MPRPLRSHPKRTRFFEQEFSEYSLPLTDNSEAEESEPVLIYHQGNQPQLQTQVQKQPRFSTTEKHTLENWWLSHPEYHLSGARSPISAAHSVELFHLLGGEHPQNTLTRRVATLIKDFRKKHPDLSTHMSFIINLYVAG